MSLSEAQLQKVKDCPGLLKDPVSGAVLNTDQHALTAYRAKRQQALQVQTLTRRVEELDSKIDRLLAVIDAVVAVSSPQSESDSPK